MGWTKDQVLDLYPEEVDPMARAILRIHGASKIADQMDLAEAVTIPWMKKGRANSFMRRKAKQRTKLLSGEDLPGGTVG